MPPSPEHITLSFTYPTPTLTYPSHPPSCPPDWCLHLIQRNDVIPQESQYAAARVRTAVLIRWKGYPTGKSNTSWLNSCTNVFIRYRRLRVYPTGKSMTPHDCAPHFLRFNLSDLYRQQICTLMSLAFKYWERYFSPKKSISNLIEKWTMMSFNISDPMQQSLCGIGR